MHEGADEHDLFVVERGVLSVRLGEGSAEREVARLSGIKSLYSDSYYSEEEFWASYDRDAYRALKRTWVVDADVLSGADALVAHPLA